jgi:glycosyltransferase involved in cell wall biosynthesis
VKILFVLGAGIISGKELITLSLMEALCERGHEVQCLTSTWGSKEFGETLAARKIPYRRTPLGFISKTFSWPVLRMNIGQLVTMPRLWWQYRRYLREFKPDIVVHTSFQYVFLLWPILNPRNTLFHVHDSFLMEKFYHRLFTFLSRRTAAFIGVSEYIKNMLIELGVPKEKAFAVLNGISAPEREEAHPGQPVTNGEVRIGIVGQIGDWKGHDDFLEALKGLTKYNLNFAGVIIGRGDADYIASLKDKIAKSDLAGKIQWAGFVKNPRDIFAATDICVVPSRSQDPCPTVAIEAAHYGIPLIATRQGGLPELVCDGETGYLVDAASPDQITEKLRLLIEDASLRDRMSQAARLHSQKHLTRDRMVEQIETVFKHVLETGAA